MKILFIGGTGNISTSVSKDVIRKGHNLFLLNRGLKNMEIEGANYLKADINDNKEIEKILRHEKWDVVVNWIAFVPEEVKRDIQLFSGKTGQYIFISSASAYQKPPSSPFITESTPLSNPYWQYSRDKIACEEILLSAYRDHGFPMTIVRPSHTYDTVIPAVFGAWTEYAFIDRMMKGKQIIIPGDGTSLWVLTHAEDFAKGFNGLLGLKSSIGHAFHITSDEVLSWNQIYQYIAEAAGCEANFVHITSQAIIKAEPDLEGNLIGDKSNSVIFDNSKIKKFVPGYEATIPFCHGIKRTLQWFREKPDRMKINPDIDKLFDKIITLSGFKP